MSRAPSFPLKRAWDEILKDREFTKPSPAPLAETLDEDDVYFAELVRLVELAIDRDRLIDEARD